MVRMSCGYTFAAPLVVEILVYSLPTRFPAFFGPSSIRGEMLHGIEN